MINIDDDDEYRYIPSDRSNICVTLLLPYVRTLVVEAPWRPPTNALDSKEVVEVDIITTSNVDHDDNIN